MNYTYFLAGLLLLALGGMVFFWIKSHRLGKKNKRYSRDISRWSGIAKKKSEIESRHQQLLLENLSLRGRVVRAETNDLLQSRFAEDFTPGPVERAQNALKYAKETYERAKQCVADVCRKEGLPVSEDDVKTTSN